MQNPTSIVHKALIAAGAPHGGGRPELFRAKHWPKRDLDKESKKYAEATQVRSIVSALIATVTFASAFTFPGGYRANGEAVVAAGKQSLAFDAFILADTLAFICSISATFTLAYAGVPAMDVSLRSRYLRISTVLLLSAATSLVTCFGLGLYLVLAPVHHTSAAVAYVIVIVTLSYYGIARALRTIRVAATVLARIGIRRYAVLTYVAYTLADTLFQVLVLFWPYIIIFGLPAFRKWIVPAIHKWHHQKQL
jgi:hypothetical protein